MMSLSTIHAMSAEAAAKAAKAKKVPMIVETEDIERWKLNPRFPFPNLGTYVPKGWRKVQEYFVDSSGWGQHGESALTGAQFVAKLKPGFGYAITEAGQFQVYVGEFEQR